MSELINIEELQEKVILIGVSTSETEDIYQSLKELSELVKTAGALSVGNIIQNREKIHPATYIGKGKIDEVRDMIFETEATGIVCDDELSPAQLKNLERELSIKVMDRTMIILDIFAKRASTSEGKIQVELAQLKYSASRLVGLRSSLSRLGGGIGTRGPGEKKIEMDRRLIHERIGQLKEELRNLKNHRELIRQNRKNSFVIALVGYTNAGKSTLLNSLTGSDIPAEDKLFATLDPTTRRLKLSTGQEVLVTDTVGFIRKLPHHLIEAFKSTLEEAKYADLIVHVVDTSSLEADSQILVVYDTLKSLEVFDKEIVTVFNKIDLVDRENFEFPRDFHSNHTIKISAKTGEGIDKLKELFEKIIRNRKILLEKTFNYNEVGKIQIIRKFGELLEEEYTDEGVKIRAYVPVEEYSNLVSKS
jgi:GTP-binding protein hflX